MVGWGEQNSQIRSEGLHKRQIYHETCQRISREISIQVLYVLALVYGMCV